MQRVGRVNGVAGQNPLGAGGRNGVPQPLAPTQVERERPVVLPAWVWVAFATACAGGALLLALSEGVRGTWRQWVAVGAGTVGVGLCAWRGVRAYRYGFWRVPTVPIDPTPIVQGTTSDFTDDEELWTELSGSLEGLFREILWKGKGDLKPEQEELPKLLGRYTALQLRAVAAGQLDQDWESPLMRVTLGNPAFMRKAVQVLADRPLGAEMRNMFGDFADSLMVYFEAGRMRGKRNDLFESLSTRLVELLEVIRKEDGEVGGWQAKAILDELEEWLPGAIYPDGQPTPVQHRHEVAFWREQFTKRLGLATRVDGGSDERDLVLPFVAEGLAESVVMLAEWLTSERGLDQIFGLVKESMTAEPSSEVVPIPDLLSDRERAATMKVIKSFLRKASQARVLDGVTGWFTKKLVDLEAQLMPSVNYGMGFLFFERPDDKQDLNPVLINLLLQGQIADLENPPSEEEQLKRAEAAEKLRADVDEFYSTPPDTSGWSWLQQGIEAVAGVYPGLAWTRSFLLAYPEVGRLLIYRVIADGMDVSLPAWTADSGNSA